MSATDVNQAARKVFVVEELLPITEVVRLLGGVCSRSVRRLSDRGEFPRPVKIGGRSMYAKSEVADYVHRKMEERKR